jgi:hypothetical protein
MKTLKNDGDPGDDPQLRKHVALTQRNNPQSQSSSLHLSNYLATHNAMQITLPNNAPTLTTLPQDNWHTTPHHYSNNISLPCTRRRESDTTRSCPNRPPLRKHIQNSRQNLELLSRRSMQPLFIRIHSRTATVHNILERVSAQGQPSVARKEVVETEAVRVNNAHAGFPDLGREKPTVEYRTRVAFARGVLRRCCVTRRPGLCASRRRHCLTWCSVGEIEWSMCGRASWGGMN